MTLQYARNMIDIRLSRFGTNKAFCVFHVTETQHTERTCNGSGAEQNVNYRHQLVDVLRGGGGGG